MDALLALAEASEAASPADAALPATAALKAQPPARHATPPKHFLEAKTGIKVSKPVVPGDTVKLKFSTMQYVPLTTLKSGAAAPTEQWLTAGVLTRKSVRTGASGQPYSLWRMSDLRGGEASLLLFGSAHGDHHREVEGSVLLLLCCKADGERRGASLSASSPDQILRIGASPGFAFCEAMTKAGEPCSCAVDRTESPLCQYHCLAQASSLRRRPVLLAQHPVSQRAPAVTPEAHVALAADGASGGLVAHTAGGPMGAVGAAARFDVAKAQTAKARLAAHISSQGGLQAPDPNDTRPPARAFTAAAAAPGALGPKPTRQRVDVLARVRAHLGLIKKNPKPGPSVAGRPAAAGAARGAAAQGARAPQRAPPTRGAQQQAPPAAALGSQAAKFAAAFGDVAVCADERADLRQRSQALVGAEQDARIDTLLAQYERRDQIATQVEATTQLHVTALYCRQCGMLSERRGAGCAGHVIERRQVIKRFWRCCACGWRTTTLAAVLPSKRCPKCRDPGMDFEPCAAASAPRPLADPDSAVASREALLPRGVEHAFSLNSLA